jgi:hypothetical protein
MRLNRRWSKTAQMRLFGTTATVSSLLFSLAVSTGVARADGLFAVMTYNVKGLPELPFVSSNRTDQMKDIAERLQDFHTVDPPYAGTNSLVGLQEVFTSDYYHILTDPEVITYAWITARDRGGDFNTGDGLTLLSDFQLSNLTRTRWEMCNGSLTEDGSDCDAPKGFTFSEVTLEPGATFHLYTLHADAGQTLQDQEARRSDIRQLIDAINLRSPEATAVVVLGDTNSRYTRKGTDNIEELSTEAGLIDVWLELRRGGIPPLPGPSIDEDCETTPSSANCELVDKIFYRSGSRLVLEPQTYEVLREMFMGTNKPLSDHDPVTVRFEYTMVPTTTSTTTSTTLPAPEDRPCGDPVLSSEDEGTDEAAVTASDALFVLRVAVGAADCPLCTCDVNASAEVSATDALIVLRAAVGQPATLDCPACEGATTTTTIL